MGDFVSLGAHEAHHGINLAIAVPATVVALLGISVAAFLYLGDGARARAAANALGVVYRTVKQKFYFDELYLFVTHRIVFRNIARPIAWFDKRVVDGGVDASGWLTRQGGWMLSRTQTGQVQTYGLWFTGGVAFLVLMLWCALA
jgi:NADH-quinone oxidoreductase subunit L